MSDTPATRPPLMSEEGLSDLVKEHAVMHHDFTEPMFRQIALAKLWRHYEDQITSGKLFTLDQVERMLSDAMGVDKVSVWAELGTKTGFGTKL